MSALNPIKLFIKQKFKWNIGRPPSNRAGVARLFLLRAKFEY